MKSRLHGRDIVARRAHGRIFIDGNLDEAAWGRASVIDGFFTIADGGSVPAAARTSVRVLWDEKNLYVGAEMEDEDIVARHTVKNSKTWEDDVFEIFIKPFGDRDGYYEFHVTPRNTTLQLFFPSRSLKGPFQNHVFEGGMQSAVSVRGAINCGESKDEGWTAEIAVPFSAFGITAPPPESGTVWTGAFCRYDYPRFRPGCCGRPKELSSSAALSILNFHRYEDYDRLVFAEE